MCLRRRPPVGTAVSQHYLLEVNSEPWQRWPGEEEPAVEITPGVAMAAAADEDIMAEEGEVPDRRRLGSTKNSRATSSTSSSTSSGRPMAQTMRTSSNNEEEGWLINPDIKWCTSLSIVCVLFS